MMRRQIDDISPASFFIHMKKTVALYPSSSHPDLAAAFVGESISGHRTWNMSVPPLFAEIDADNMVCIASMSNRFLAFNRLRPISQSLQQRVAHRRSDGISCHHTSSWLPGPRNVRSRFGSSSCFFSRHRSRSRPTRTTWLSNKYRQRLQRIPSQEIVLSHDSMALKPLRRSARVTTRMLRTY